MEYTRLWKINTSNCEALIFKSSTNSVSIPVSINSYLVNSIDSTCPITTLDHQNYIIILKDQSTLFSINPFLNLISYQIDLSKIYLPIISLSDKKNSDIALIDNLGSLHILNVILNPKDDLIKKFLKSSDFLIGTYTHEYLWLQYLAALSLNIKSLWLGCLCHCIDFNFINW